MIGHVWVLGVLYKWAPGVYLWWAKRRYRHTNPDFIADVSSRLSDEWWPVILWRDAKRYLKAGGLEAYPGAQGFEDALYRDVAQRRDTPGPIKDALDLMRSAVDHAAESLVSDHGGADLKQAVKAVLARDRRLAGMLDSEDLSQYAMQLLVEVASDPSVEWKTGKDWPPDRLQADGRFFRDVLQSMAARDYGSNKKIERERVVLEDSGPAVDARSEAGFESVEWRMTYDGVLAELPPKQREAMEVALEAERQGLSLAEMSRHLGRDPEKDGDNFKAVKRRYRV